jgi:hypothetical protein
LSFILLNKDTVVSTGFDGIKLPDVPHVFLVNDCVPEHNGHFMLLWLGKGKDKSVVKESPFILRLDVSK